MVNTAWLHVPACAADCLLGDEAVQGISQTQDCIYICYLCLSYQSDRHLESSADEGLSAPAAQTQTQHNADKSANG